MSKMSTKQKVFAGLGIYVLLIIIVAVGFGWKKMDQSAIYKPIDEFKTDTWISLPGPFDFNKAIMYILIAGFLTVVTMVYVARRMQARPNKVQTVVEMAYGVMRDNITRGNMDEKMARKWFPFIASLFLFIWFSNMIGYLPLPTNSGEKWSLFGLKLPSFALYAATANISVPLVLAVVVWFSFVIEGVRAKGPIGYLKSLIPKGVTGIAAGPIFALELFSTVMRLMSLSVRLFANILAGHLIILFMGGALVVLLGIEALGVITLPLGVVLFVFEVGLVASLQAFIFATLAAIYLGGAVAAEH